MEEKIEAPMQARVNGVNRQLSGRRRRGITGARRLVCLIGALTILSAGAYSAGDSSSKRLVAQSADKSADQVDYQAPRYEINELRLPVPTKSTFAQLPWDRPPLYFETAPVDLFLNKQGLVDSLHLPESWQVRRSVDRLVDSLLTLTFLPAEFRGEKIDFLLKAELLIPARAVLHEARLISPLDSSGRLEDYELYRSSCEVNGFLLPQLINLPWYFYLKPKARADTATVCPMALLAITIDSTGAPVNRRVVYSSNKSLGEMMLTVSGWADFRPGNFAGEPIGGDGYLLVRFFRELQYPTDDWNYFSQAPDSALHRARVRWFVGDQIPDLYPLLRQVGSHQLIQKLPYNSPAPRQALFWSNPDGTLSIELSTRFGTSDILGTLTKSINSLRFYPAMRFVASDDSSGLIPKQLRALGKLELSPDSELHHALKEDFGVRIFRLPRTTSAR